STADDAGRRYLIGVAAAAQSAIFAVWTGFALVLGFPDRATTIARLLTLPLNVCAIGIAACVSYALIGLRRCSARAARRGGCCSPPPSRFYRLVESTPSLASVARSKRPVSRRPLLRW